MAVELFSNLATTTVVSGGTTAPAAGTVETWTVASSASFPAAATAATTQFRVQEDDTTRQSEVILVTNVTGTTWTVTRGAESTTPVAHPSGFTIVQTITAGVLAAMAQSSATKGAAVNTTETLSAATGYTDLATVGPSVTVAVGASGSVVVGVAIYANHTNLSYSTAAVAVSGATTRAAQDTESVGLEGASGSLYVTVSRLFVMSGLTSGQNTFTVKYQTGSSGAVFLRRTLVVIPL